MKRLLTLALLACSLSARAQQWYVMSDTNGNWLDPITLVRPGNSNQLSAWLTLAGFSGGGPTNGVSAAVATNIAAVQVQLATNFMWTNVTLYVGNFTNFPTAVITNLFFTNGTGQNLVVSNLTVLGTQTYNNAAFTNLNVLGYLNVAGATTNNGLAVFNNAVLLNGNANITGGLVVFGLTTLDNILNLSAQPIVQVSSIGFSGPIALTNALGGIGSGGLFADTNGNVSLSPQNAASPVLNFQPHFLGWGFTNVYGVGYLATWTNLGALVFGNSGWQIYQMSQVTPGDNVTLSLFDPTNSSVGANNAGGVTLAGKSKLSPLSGQAELPAGVTGGTAPRILNDKLGEYKSIADYGASTNAVDNSLAIQAAINYVSTNPFSKVFVPAGVWPITNTVFIKTNGVALYGVNKQTSILSWSPAGVGMPVICLSNGVNHLYNSTLRDFQIVTASTNSSTAIAYYDASACAFDHVYINHFFSSASNSVGVAWHGRDTSSFDNFQIQADIPLAIYTNQTGPLGFDCDLMTFGGHPCLLQGSGAGSTNAAVFIGPSAALTRTTFRNVDAELTYHGWYGVNLNQSYGNRLVDCAIEQSATTNGWNIFLSNSNTPLQGFNLTIQNFRGQNTMNGIYLDGFRNVNISQFYWDGSPGTTNIALQTTTNVINFTLDQCYFSPYSYAYTTGMVCSASFGQTAGGSPLPNNGYFKQTASGLGNAQSYVGIQNSNPQYGLDGFSTTLNFSNVISQTGVFSNSLSVSGVSLKATNATPFYTLFGGLIGVTGTGITAMGYDAGGSGSGNFNSLFGFEAGANLGVGADNTFMGWEAGVQDTTGGNNVAIGQQVSANNQTGANNTAIGAYALEVPSYANDNTAVGEAALELGVALTNNTAIGIQSGAHLTNGFGNVFVGAYADDTLGPSENNTLNVGNALFATGINSSTTNVATSPAFGIGKPNPAHALDVGGSDGTVMATNVITGSISVIHGSNKRSGTAVLSGGTVVVANTTVASGDYAILSYVTTGTQVGILSAPLSLMTNGSAFVINSSYTNTVVETGDTNIVAWLLYNQN